MAEAKVVEAKVVEAKVAEAKVVEAKVLKAWVLKAMGEVRNQVLMSREWSWADKTFR